jgi:hypothetical protein
MRSALRFVRLTAVCALLFGGCTTTGPSIGVESGGYATGSRRGHGVIVVDGERTHYFENYHPHCLAYTLPGEWEFGIQEGVVRRIGGRGPFVGVMLTSAQHLPGGPDVDGVSRVVSEFQRKMEQDWDQPVASTVTPFPATQSGAVLLEFGTVVMTPRTAARTYGGAEVGTVVGLPKRVIVPFVDGVVLILTVPDAEHARHVLSTLQVSEDPRCWHATIRQRFPNIRWRK